MISWNDVDIYLNTKLSKPAIINPCVYTTPGLDTLEIIPHKVLSTGNLPMINNDVFEFEEGLSHYEIKVEGNHSFYIINKEFCPHDNFSKTSHNNHLKFGYGKLPLLDMPDLPFSEVIGCADSERSTWWNECVNAARQIYNEYKSVAVCLSGGLDSELTSCAFIDAGVPFKNVFMIYKDLQGNIINNYDYQYVLDFCKLHNVDLMTFDINIVADLADYRHRDYYLPDKPETHFLVSGLYTHHLLVDMMNNLGYIVVMGSDQIELKKDSNQNVCIGETSFSLGLATPTWAHLTNKKCIYDFFLYTPNQIVSYMDIPEVQTATAIDYEFKDYICRKYGSNRLGPKRNKATGYEQLSSVFRQQLNREYHQLTIDNIDFVNWKKRASTQYIHRISKVVECGYYDDWQIIRTTPNDFLCMGFIENDTRYFDL
jgi:hypothetical protein